jgi:hypothetical protein
MKNTAVWNLLIVATVIVGATVTLMIFDRQDLTKHKKQPHGETRLAKEPDTETPKSTIDSATAEPVVPEPIVEVKQTTTLLPSAGDFILVAASFRHETHAKNFVNDFKQKIRWSDPEVIAHSQNDTTYFRVVALHSRSWRSVASNRDSLVAAGYADAWIYKQQ